MPNLFDYPVTLRARTSRERTVFTYLMFLTLLPPRCWLSLQRYNCRDVVAGVLDEMARAPMQRFFFSFAGHGRFRRASIEVQPVDGKNCRTESLKESYKQLLVPEETCYDEGATPCLSPLEESARRCRHEVTCQLHMPGPSQKVRFEWHAKSCARLTWKLHLCLLWAHNASIN